MLIGEVMISSVHLSSQVVENNSEFGVYSAPVGNEGKMQNANQESIQEVDNYDNEMQQMQYLEQRFDDEITRDFIEEHSGDEQDRNALKRKQYQTQRLEEYFKECPHPDDNNRKELSAQLGLEPLQVKFWFQNKTTLKKNQHERCENLRLKEENDKLLTENITFKEALSSAYCLGCGGAPPLGEMSFDEHELRIENARLQEEINRVSAIAAKYGAGEHAIPPTMLSVGGPSCSHIDNRFTGIAGHCVDWERESNRPYVVELAETAMVELVEMSEQGEPLWARRFGSLSEHLNDEEYYRRFYGGLRPRTDGWRREVSRDSVVVCINCQQLVDFFMDVNNWVTFFSSIVSSARTEEMYSCGNGAHYDGALQLMTAELQFPTPLVPNREIMFLRHSKKQGEGVWAIVDVSFEVGHNPMIGLRRRPSGCVIKQLPDGYSKVTWVEHVEVVDTDIHNLYKPVVTSCIAFGAKRWLAALARQCERLVSLIQINSLATKIDENSDAAKNILKLAERMIVSYCSGVSGSTAHHWIDVTGVGAEDVKIRSRMNNDDPGRPAGNVICASTSFWLPNQPKRIFDFLRNAELRSQWDILINRGIMYESMRIGNTHNRVSILCVNNTEEQSNMIVQESWRDETGCYVVYAPIDVASLNGLLNGSNPNFVALVPSGFSIIPDGLNGNAELGNEGSLLTVSFQIIVDPAPGSKLLLASINTVDSLIACTAKRIKEYLSRN